MKSPHAWRNPPSFLTLHNASETQTAKKCTRKASQFNWIEHALVLVGKFWVNWKCVWRKVLDHVMLYKFGDAQEYGLKRFEGEYGVNIWINSSMYWRVGVQRWIPSYKRKLFYYLFNGLILQANQRYITVFFKNHVSVYDSELQVTGGWPSAILFLIHL